jgi:hypothetical protein
MGPTDFVRGLPAEYIKGSKRTHGASSGGNPSGAASSTGQADDDDDDSDEDEETEKSSKRRQKEEESKKKSEVNDLKIAWRYQGMRSVSAAIGKTSSASSPGTPSIL